MRSFLEANPLSFRMHAEGVFPYKSPMRVSKFPMEGFCHDSRQSGGGDFHGDGRPDLSSTIRGLHGPSVRADSESAPASPAPARTSSRTVIGLPGHPSSRSRLEAPASCRRPCATDRSRSIDCQFWASIVDLFTGFLRQTHRIRSKSDRLPASTPDLCLLDLVARRHPILDDVKPVFHQSLDSQVDAHPLVEAGTHVDPLC
jgi:hypothetical protein